MKKRILGLLMMVWCIVMLQAASASEIKPIELKVGGNSVGTYNTLEEILVDEQWNDRFSGDSLFESNVEILVSQNAACGSFYAPKMAEGCTVTLKSASGECRSITGAGITINSGAQLILENIILDGSGSSSRIVTVSNGTLSIGNGAVITNGNSMAYEAGVVLQPSSGETAKMQMSGGTISNCVRGVYLDESFGGTVEFEMSGGSITGNGITFGWGGVLVGSGAQFTMTGGSITNNAVSGYSNGGITLNAGGSLTIGGSAQVLGNGGANIMLQDWNGSVFIVQQGFTGKVGITSSSSISGTGRKPVTVAGSTGYQQNYIGTNIVPDLGTQEIVFENNALYLAVHNHTWNYIGSQTDNKITVKCAKSTCQYYQNGIVMTCDASALNKTYDGKRVSGVGAVTTGLEELINASKYYYYGLSYYFVGKDGTQYVNPYNPLDVGEYYYVMTLVDNANGRQILAEARAPFAISRGIPKAADFTVTLPDERVYDGKAKTVSASGKNGMGPIAVNYFDGENNPVTVPVHAGSYTVKIDVEQGAYYEAANDLTDSAWSFTIEPKALTIQAKDQLAVVDGGIAQGAEYVVVNGLEEGDVLTDISLVHSGTGAAAQGTIEPLSAVIQNANGETVTGDYDISYQEGALTVVEDMQDVQSKTIQIPLTDAVIQNTDLAAIPELDTLEEVQHAMRSRILSSGTGYTEENVMHHDVRLQFSLDGGRTWIDATEENFPKEGILVVLEYPAGTSMITHDFIVTHMFTTTSDRLKTKAGEIEIPPVTKTEKGIEVMLNGLSPVSVAWKNAEVSADHLPETGDHSALTAWMLLLGASALMMAGVKRRRAN